MKLKPKSNYVLTSVESQYFPFTNCSSGEPRVAPPSRNPRAPNAPYTPPNRIRTEIDHRRRRELVFSSLLFSPLPLLSLALPFLFFSFASLVLADGSGLMARCPWLRATEIRPTNVK